MQIEHGKKYRLQNNLVVKMEKISDTSHWKFKGHVENWNYPYFEMFNDKGVCYHDGLNVVKEEI